MYRAKFKRLFREALALQSFFQSACGKIKYCLLVGVLLSASCSFFEPHKISIQQGSLVTAKSLDQLKIGMNKEQVQYILGTPLAVDTFDPDYWVYNYSLRVDTEVLAKRFVKLRFENDSLISIDSEGVAPAQAKTAANETLADEKAPVKNDS